MAKIKQLPPRAQVKESDTWDLASLFADDAAWEKAFQKWEKQIPGYEAFRGKLADSAASLAACLKFDVDFERAGERLGTFASLKTTEDTANSTYQRMIGRYRNVATRAAQAASYLRPEIMAIPAKTMEKFLGTNRWPNIACSWNRCCATRRTRCRSARSGCWRCRARCPTRRTSSFVS